MLIYKTIKIIKIFKIKNKKYLIKRNNIVRNIIFNIKNIKYCVNIR